MYTEPVNESKHHTFFPYVQLMAYLLVTAENTSRLGRDVRVQYNFVGGEM
jgi:hypothetical protein